MIKILIKKNQYLVLFFIFVVFLLFWILKQGFLLPFYWDTEWFLIAAAGSIAETSNLFSYLGFSDYPHTFLLPLAIALILQMPGNHLLLIHILGLLLSIFFLIVMYLLGNKLVNKKVGMALVLLFLTNPLFLAQTHLVYFEIIGTALRFLAVIFLLEKKYLRFTIIGLIAILTRIDNSLFLSASAIAYLFLEKEITNKLNWIIRYVFPFLLTTVLWLVIHLQITGWWIYSPERYFDEQPWQSLWDAIVYITVRQGRYIISESIFVMLLTSKKLIQQIKKISIPGLILGITSLPSLLMITKLGYFLPRYIFPVLPVFYLLFLVLLQKLIKKPILFWAIIILIGIIQYQYRYDCYAGNSEDCLLVIDLLVNEK
ncbi:MAG: hypothetical protein A2383_00720 [Candidatus Pacebacteria bacterium RIFOXYB1_FULL_39_46]|nr:MAG: hypothetical protein A2182_00555 [Candidatus Pacebacteria bacterium RIFOXYA1_FULL_38_18]OGJ38110.1 MAG: hypothetical protein A2383_00720 [Candidatus Pacebacteria bacterium RIFOXYB1_FULL_39_46]OGJ39668.1 MAG: hypothetical protein A2411_02720 [Candidatus Pacebacteria bacterium RIFOXYC1_FULL_39_21]OGJ39862.1 MAG: hypothetical protein A2582_00485 [Candidatus Pacebacteria bacterium RIFOXYD1_FULL_39_27]